MFEFKSVPTHSLRMPKLTAATYAQVKVHIQTKHKDARTKLEVDQRLTDTEQSQLRGQIKAFECVLAILSAADKHEKLRIEQARIDANLGERRVVESYVENTDGWFMASEVNVDTGIALKRVKELLEMLWRSGKLKKRRHKLTPNGRMLNQYSYIPMAVEEDTCLSAGSTSQKGRQSL